MTYKATPPRQLLLFFIVLIGIPNLVISFHEGTLYYPYFFIAFLVLSMFITYEFHVSESNLQFGVFLFKLPLYRKQIHPEELTEIHFRRFGFVKMGAVLKRKQGINIRLFDFFPQGLEAALVHFSQRNEIPMTKAKDYKVR